MTSKKVVYLTYKPPSVGLHRRKKLKNPAVDGGQ